jgi:hypothetical protein
MSFPISEFRIGTGNGKDGIDCSGFTSSVYSSAVKMSLPRSARDQFRVGSEVGSDQLEFGDLVFFNTTGRSPSHVGIYLEDDLFAHASVTSGVTISSLESTYFKKRFLGARRVVHKTRKDPIASFFFCVEKVFFPRSVEIGIDLAIIFGSVFPCALNFSLPGARKLYGSTTTICVKRG